jgi:hypothetical protein
MSVDGDIGCIGGSQSRNEDIVTKTLVGLSLFICVGFVFLESPVRYLADSRYALLMDQAILERGTPNMKPYQVPRGVSSPYTNHGYLWTIDIVKGRLLYIYPWGGPLLSLPAVAVLNAAGFKVAPQGIYNEGNELALQVWFATVLCAAAVWLFFDMAATMLPLRWSVAIALSAAFGTQLWSTTSRNLWPQTWNLLLISLSVWLLMKPRIQPLVLGTVLAWACFARPQGSPIALMVGVYVLLEYGWRCLLPYAVAGAAWTAVFAATLLHFFGQLSSPVYRHGLSFPHEFFLRLSGILVSPSRGLLIFVPIVLMPLYLTLRYWQELSRRRLVLLALAAILSQIITIASWNVWWGGGSYGPRLLVDTIPWFLVLAVLGVKAFLDDQRLSVPERAAVISIGLLLLTVSVAMNAVGAMSASATSWSQKRSIDVNPQQVWDWGHPQFLAWAQDG